MSIRRGFNLSLSLIPDEVWGLDDEESRDWLHTLIELGHIRIFLEKEDFIDGEIHINHVAYWEDDDG